MTDRIGGPVGGPEGLGGAGPAKAPFDIKGPNQPPPLREVTKELNERGTGKGLEKKDLGALGIHHPEYLPRKPSS